MSPAVRLSVRALALLALPLLAGCTRNAFLELQIDLPKNDYAGDRYAVVQVVAGEVSFDQEWAGGDAIPPVKLGASPQSMRVSVEGDADTEQKPLRVKLKFCKSPQCTELADDVAPQLRLQLDRAFYIGERTSYTWSVACVPNVKGQTDPPPVCEAQKQLTVPKCKVAGCRSGITSEYCAGGKHFCE